MSHEIIRNTETWGSYGINGDEPLTIRLIKDISDSHLNNIINFINSLIFYDIYKVFYGKMYKVMCDELEFRRKNNITVSDYFEFKNFKFGR